MDRGHWRRTGCLSLLVLTALAVAPTAANAFVYWTNDITHSIGRANLDGSATVQPFISIAAPIGYPGGIAVDATHIYWGGRCYSAPSCGAIGRANLDGTGIEPTLVGGIDPGDVAVDAEHVYWTWSACEGLGTDRCSVEELLAGPPAGIARANLDGTGVEQNFISGVDAGSVAIDAQRIYWTGRLCDPECSESSPSIVPAIGRANLDGTGVDRRFISALATGPLFTRELTGLAVDAEHIYWTGMVFDFNPGTALGRANLDGTDVNPAFVGGVTGLKSAYWSGVVVDDGHIYWTDSGPIGEESIDRSNLDGSVVEGIINGTEDPYFNARALAVDSLADTKAKGKVRAAKTQRQGGNSIVVKVELKAKEKLTAAVAGKVIVTPTYKLKRRTVGLAAGETRALKLKPKRRPQGKRIAEALERGERATAKLKATLSDQGGNSKTVKLRVRLR